LDQALFINRVIPTKITAPTNATVMDPIIPPAGQIPTMYSAHAQWYASHHFGNVTATVGSLTRGGEDDSGTIHSGKSKSKENRNDAKDY